MARTWECWPTLRAAPDVRASFDLARTFGRLEELSLDPLGLGELHQLLKDRLGLELSRPELARVLETSGGNPFFALEIGRQLTRTRGAIRVPASLKQALGSRLARLPDADDGRAARRRGVRAPDGGADVAVCDAPREAVRDALDGAAREGVVALRTSECGSPTRCWHPLSYEQAAPWKRRAVHARLATAVDDPEERARHFALAADGADTDGRGRAR